MKDVILGIDIGGTNTKFGFLDRDGISLVQGELSTNEGETVHDFLRVLYQEVMTKFKKIEDEANLIGVGVGAPNGNYYTGTIENAPNLKWHGSVPLVDLLKQYFKMPVFLTNDANAAAIGEMVYGGAKNMNNFVVITLGTGLGSGIVVNGQLVYGHDGNAGEIGHTLVNVNGRGRMCGCGRKGCLETYVSATGIKRTVYKLLADSTDYSELRSVSFNDLTAEMITQAAKRGDKIAIDAFEYTGKVLGMKLADTVAHLSPEAIFLFGGLVRAEEFLFDPVRYHMEKNLLHIFKGKVKILPSGLGLNNTAVMGAAALAWNEMERGATA
ncbi:ROK family protein [Nibribacter ruber]|uniref:ROK family protein n=1 Tax=Nibribacter ruber TaxID=2698458 RepID=A0A6P1NSJ2_9BACT|nr:ROK family protein [Nibribacter ruber]QHL86657.1 ROK family protein [Nibribacter ruber]